MKIGIAQMNSIVGDFPRNAKGILQAYRACINAGADIVLTPELSLVGYPPRDLVTKKTFVRQCHQALDYLADEIGEIPLIVGYVDYHDFEAPGRPLRNAAAFLHNGGIKHKAFKTLLPSYDIFDESRYFEPSAKCEAFEYGGKRIGLTIGEDIWMDDFIRRPSYDRDPIAELKQDGVDVIFNISASPFFKGVPKNRSSLMEVVACGANAPVVCCNAVGMNEQFVFDGNSLVLDAEGKEIANLPGFKACYKVIDIDAKGSNEPMARSADVEDISRALVMGIKDYTRKAGFEKVVVSMNGSIESSLTASLAVDALGKNKVIGITYSEGFEMNDQENAGYQVAKRLGIEHKVVPIHQVKDSALLASKELMEEIEHPLVDEGMSARIRAMLMMAYARNNKYLILSTANKTDLSVGHFYVGGEDTQGLAVLSDVPKVIVHKLARHMAAKQDVLDLTAIEQEEKHSKRLHRYGKELAPPYVILDLILNLYMFYQLPAEVIIENHGYDESTVRWVQRKVDLNEWKRHHCAPGIRVTSRAFGISRRMPLVQSFIG
ncbi:NAD(+) synthase [Rubritalea marina]|uniref:NAD(+) synthase n=1 Tax=Rubritalea marina TaxID=361055 RepID=UPI0003787410|nr:NAD(+) synthase [Rubritalea marina]